MANRPEGVQIVEGFAQLLTSISQMTREVILEEVDFERLSRVAERIRLVANGVELWDWVEKASKQSGFLPFRTVPFDDFYQKSGDNYNLFYTHVSEYYANHQQEILHSIATQITVLDVSSEPKATLLEAIEAHGHGLFRLTCRGLLPDIERVVREDWIGESGVGQVKVWKIEKAIEEKYLEDLTPDNWFNLVLFNLLINHLYRDGKHIKDFRENPFPNRHAALHGWLDYPSQENSLSSIIFADYIYRLGSKFKEEFN